ncbi:MAG: stressosome-associated protein Prli42 [Caldibacillus sp.]
MRRRKTRKIILYLMLFVMIASTLLGAISIFF